MTSAHVRYLTEIYVHGGQVVGHCRRPTTPGTSHSGTSDPGAVQLEAGVNLRVIQQYLGHAQIKTTPVYLHLTHTGQEDAYTRINSLMEGL